MGENLPSNIYEVESLVLSLYEPRPPESVAQIQEVLHRLQHSHSGWQTARDLLARKDDKVRFFGALTIVIKLNTESSTLSEGDANELLQSLLDWMATSIRDGSGALVVRKLASALVAFLIHFPSQWPRCVRHVCWSLSQNHEGFIQKGLETTAIIDNLSRLAPLEVQAALWFTGVLVEEAARLDLNSSKNQALYRAILDNIADAVALMNHAFALEFNNQPDIMAREASIKCLQSWVWFSQKSSLLNNAFIEPLRTLVHPAITAILDDHLFNIAAEFFADTLSNYSGFLTESHHQALFRVFETQWSRERYQRLVEGDFDFDSIQFGQLMISLGDSRVQELILNPDERSQSFLMNLGGLLGARGYPVGEDRIFVPALEFWATFVETLTDCIYSDNATSPAWGPSATAHVLRAVSCVWRKVAFPASETFSTWDSADRAGFVEARKDVADFLQSTFTVTGPSILAMFANLSLQSLSPTSWAEFEAATFCLGSLADCIVGDVRCDEILETFFSTPIFEVLNESRTATPTRVRQTCVTLLERYADYFERNTQKLPAALGLLFEVIGDRSLAGSAAKSILRLCSSSRNLLAPETIAFLDHYQTLSIRGQLDCLTSERIVGAIASVIQAVRLESERFGYIQKLLSFLQSDVQVALQLATSSSSLGMDTGATIPEHRCSLGSSENDLPLHLALKASRCLITMGRGLQVPVDGTVNLEAEHIATCQAQSGKLAEIQFEILSMMERLQNAFPRSAEVCENICMVFRTGFSETEPGPFVFPPNVVCEYLVRQTWRQPRIGLFVSTACSFISSLDQSIQTESMDIVASLVSWVFRLLQAIGAPEDDTELAQNGIEFVTRVVSKRSAVLFHAGNLQDLEFFFIFSLRVLDGREPLPKAAAAEFWATFLALKSSNEHIQEKIAQIIAHFGPLLAQCLMKNIGGNAARSELDKLSEPFKKLVSQHAQARTWLENALYDPSFPGQLLTREEKLTFLKKSISLRGSRATNQVVREFWLAARGSKFTYAP